MSQEQFELAQRLASLAVELDESPGTPDFARHLCVDHMHAMANKLAGDRAGEIYDLTEEVEA